MAVQVFSSIRTTYQANLSPYTVVSKAVLKRRHPIESVSVASYSSDGLAVGDTVPRESRVSTEKLTVSAETLSSPVAR